MSNEERIPTNLRTLMILEIIGSSNTPLTPTQINASLGLPKQTVHRLCATLEAEGFLVREPNGKRLQASSRLKHLASGILFNSRSQLATRQVLLEVAKKVNETVNLVIPEDDGMMYLDRVETDWPFRIQLPAGSHVPFHCTASGKTFLASLPLGKRKQVVESQELTPLTKNTFNDKEAFMTELSRVAKQGYAVDNEEFMEGMIAIAVPLMDEKGRYTGALAFHAPTQRMKLQDALQHRQTLLDGAVKLSKTLFN